MVGFIGPAKWDKMEKEKRLQHLPEWSSLVTLASENCMEQWGPKSEESGLQRKRRRHITHSTGGVWIVKVGKRSRGLGGAHDDGPWGRRGHTEVLEVACLLMEVIRRQESRRK